MFSLNRSYWAVSLMFAQHKISKKTKQKKSTITTTTKTTKTVTNFLRGLFTVSLGEYFNPVKTYMLAVFIQHYTGNRCG